MKKAVLGFAVILTGSVHVVGQTKEPPKQAIDISAAEIQQIIDHPPTRSVDQQIKVIDIGKYNLAGGVIHRPATPAPAAGAGRQGGGRGPNPNAVKCGPATAPAGAK